MGTLVGVGGNLGPVAPGGWDLWPLVGLVTSLWIGRRMAGLPWRAPLLLVGLAGSLLLPPVVAAWGVIPALAVAIVASFVVRRVRSTRRDPPPETV